MLIYRHAGEPRYIDLDKAPVSGTSAQRATFSFIKFNEDGKISEVKEKSVIHGWLFLWLMFVGLGFRVRDGFCMGCSEGRRRSL